MKRLNFQKHRRNFLLSAGALTSLAVGSSLNQLGDIMNMILNQNEKKESEQMPVVFIGHGNPMNALAKNAFTDSLERLGTELPRPKAILCVSAHWLSAGTWVTHMPHPKTIHDFYGFPKELFNVQYPAPGSPQIAEMIQSLSKSPKIHADDTSWGLDHGTWAVLRKMYPQADIPVLQLSIDMSEPPSYHFQLGQTLKALREQGVLILGSGNIVHNLRRVDWDKPGQGTDWAIEFDEWVKNRIDKRDFKSVTENFAETQAGRWSVPTPDHYYPMLYVLGAVDPKDELKFEFEGYDMGSISMSCFSFGRSSV